jgi:hypothetical protein
MDGSVKTTELLKPLRPVVAAICSETLSGVTQQSA